MNLVDLGKKKKICLNKSSWLLVGHKTFIIIYIIMYILQFANWLDLKLQVQMGTSDIYKK